MSLEDSETSIFTLNSKVKKYLRQTLEDKCSKIGGRQVYFGLDDAMIRMLTPIEEVMTPVPGQLLSAGNRTSWTLSNLEDYPESSSEQGLTDVSTHRTRHLLGPDIGSRNDFNKTRHKKDDAAQTKSDSTTKTKSRAKKPLSAEQKSDSADTRTSDRNKKTVHLSGGRGDRRIRNDQLDKEIKTDVKNQKKPLVSVQILPDTGDRVTSIELQTIPIGRKGSNDRKQNQSCGPGNRSGPRVSYTNVMVKCTLPHLDADSSRIAKKSFKTKSNETVRLPVNPSRQQVDRSVKCQTGARVRRLPPIKTVSGISTSVQRRSTQEVKLAKCLKFHDSKELVISEGKPERVDTVRDNISLPSINLNQLPAIDRGVPGGTKYGGKESTHSNRKYRVARSN